MKKDGNVSKTKNMTKLNFLYIIILFTAFVSCKTTTKIAKKSDTSDTIGTLIKNVQLAEPVYQTANFSKMGMEISYNARKYNVAANCKIIKDSAIFVSIQPMLGIELFKAEISPDSIFLFDKMNRRLYAFDFNYLNQNLGVNVNFYNLQSLISNQLFCIGEIKIPIEDCSIKNEPNGKAAILFNTKKLSQTTIIAENNTIEKIIISEIDSKHKLTTEYSEYQLTDNINFPKKININLNSSKNKIICNFNINKVTFNTNITLSKSDKTNYTRAKIDQLLNK